MSVLSKCLAVLTAVEHVRLPDMPIARCPVCLSPNDASQPHEAGCALNDALSSARAMKKAIDVARRATELEDA